MTHSPFQPPAPRNASQPWSDCSIAAPLPRTRPSSLARRAGERARARGLLGAALVGLAVHGLATAQTVYRIVGPDGKVTFTDRPPAQAPAEPVSTPAGTASSAAARAPVGGADLPAALRPVVRSYPVTLYTSANCPPCDQGRSLLKQRGIPFNEKTVNTQADLQAFQKLAPSAGGVPLLMVGAQAIPGFSASEWNSYLDAAGYPKTSALPPGYTHPPAQALVPPKPVDPEATASTATPASPADSPSAAEPAPKRVRPQPVTRKPEDNPAGIRF